MIRLRLRLYFEVCDICVGIRWRNTWDFPEGTWRAFSLFIYPIPMCAIRLMVYRPDEAQAQTKERE